MAHDERTVTLDYYARGLESARLDIGAGLLERLRTEELVARHLPPSPAVVADIGGGPGRYAAWLAAQGYAIVHRDLSPLHVEQVQALGDVRIDSGEGDARALDLGDASVDAVLLLGPLYHLRRRADRIAALSEARRIVRPGGFVFAAVITRWAARIYGTLHEQLYRELPISLLQLPGIERTGVLPPLHPGSFNGFSHRPRQLAAEIRAADLDVADLVTVEGPAALLPDLDARLADPTDAAIVLDACRALERVPELMGVGPHLLATARRRDA